MSKVVPWDNQSSTSSRTNVPRQGSISNFKGSRPNLRSNNALNDDTQSVYSSYTSRARKTSIMSGQTSKFKGDASEREPAVFGIIRPRFAKREDSDLYCVKFVHQDEYICVGLGDGTIKVYSTKTQSLHMDLICNADQVDGWELYPLLTQIGAYMPVTSIAMRPERKEFRHGGVILASYADGRMIHWHYISGQKLSQVQEPEVQVNVVQYSPTGSLFAAAGSQTKISVYDGISQKLKFHLVSGKSEETAGHSNRIFALRFHPKDHNCLISAGWDDTIQIWDLQKVLYPLLLGRDTRLGQSFRPIFAETLWT